MPPKAEQEQITAEVTAHCDAVIALGKKSTKLSVASVCEATGWGRTAVYRYKLHDLIQAKEKVRREAQTDRRRSRDTAIAEVQDALARAQAENDRLRAQLLLLEENAIKAGVPPDTLYAPVDLPPRAVSKRGRRGGMQIA
jgi:hypothetical protein